MEDASAAPYNTTLEFIGEDGHFYVVKVAKSPNAYLMAVSVLADYVVRGIMSMSRAQVFTNLLELV